MKKDNSVQQKERKYKEYLKNNPLPLPSKEQVDWLDAEIGMFCHFGINTFYNKEWSDGSLDPIKFNPTKLDCNNWVKVAKDMGAKYMILTAKHHDGFCLWPTKTTDYSVKSTPYKEGKGDIVKEFIDACKKEEMPVGLYLSPWDRHEPCYANKEEYDKFYLAQLTEILTSYDVDMFEIWFDGAGSEGREYDWDSIMAVCNKHHPKAMIFSMGKPTIRWVGNELGYAPDPNWCVLKMGKDFTEMEKTEIKGVGLLLESCDGLGNYWLPAECDVPIRKRFFIRLWFYHPHSRLFLRSYRHLIRLYEKSVGRGANLLLNLAPNRDGLIDRLDAKRARQLGAEIKRRYNKNNIVAKTQGEGEILTISLEQKQKINCVVLQEEISEGQRVREYEVEYLGQEGKWEILSKGTSIGHKKIDRFKSKKVKQVRINITNSLAPPILKNFSLLFIKNK